MSRDGPPAVLVLDTNVVLDWLFFRDPRCAALDEAVAAGVVCWAASAAMRDELRSVLERGVGRLRTADAGAILERFDRCAVRVEPAAPVRAIGLRCSDADDQKFIDLALQLGACTLLSRDKAVLRLARRARPHALRIVAPAGWTTPPAVARGLSDQFFT